MLNRQQRHSSQQRVTKHDSIQTSNPRLKRLREMREIVDLRDQLDRIQHQRVDKRQGLGHSVSYRQGGGSGLLPGRTNGGEVALFEMQKGATQVSELSNHNHVGVTAGGQRWLDRGNPKAGSRIGVVPGDVRRGLANLLSDDSATREREESDQFASRRLFQQQPHSTADDGDLNRTTVGEGTVGSSLHQEQGRQKTSTAFGHFIETPNRSGKMTLNWMPEQDTRAALSDSTSKIGDARDRGPPFRYPPSTTNNKIAKKNIFAQQAKAGLQLVEGPRRPLRGTAGNLSMDLAIPPAEQIRSEVRTELISQFTSKMSETAMSQRRLEQMGLKGRSPHQNSASRALSGKKTPPTEQEPQSEQPSSPSLKITRFMSDKEKTTIWIAQQRQGLLDQSLALEAELKKEKDIERAADLEQSSHEVARRSGQASFLLRSKLQREALPTLTELPSRGTNLSQRIRNYKANLTALDAPVMDQIQATQQRWNKAVEAQEARERNRDHASLGTQIEAILRRSKSPKRAPKGHYEGFQPISLEPEVKKKLGKVILQRMRANQQSGVFGEGPLVPPAKSKAEIRHSLEERVARLQREVQARGAKMQGSTGDLGLSLEDFEQNKVLRLPAQIQQKRQMDLLVYRQKSNSPEWTGEIEKKGRSTISKKSSNQDADPLKRRRQAYSLGNRQASALEVRQHMDMDEKLHGVKTLISIKPPGQPYDGQSSRKQQHRQRVNDLGMLKNHKPTEKGKREQFRREHKRIITYIEDLKTTIHNPLSYDWKKQQCLAEAQVEGLERLGEMEGRGAEAIAAEIERQRGLRAQMVQLLGQGSSILCTDESLVADNDSFQEMVKGIQSLALDSPEKASAFPLQLHNAENAGQVSAPQGHRGLRTANETREGGPWLPTLSEAAEYASPGAKVGPDGVQSRLQSGGDGPYSPEDAERRDFSAFGSAARAGEGPEIADDLSAKGSEFARGTQSDFTRTMKNGRFFKDANKKAHEKKIIEGISDELIDKLKQIKKKRMYASQQSKVYLADNFPAFAFFAQCIRECQLDIPLFEKMRENTLEVKNQKLSAGHCEAIKQGLRVVSESLATEEGSNQYLNHVILNNNGLGDAQQALILQGMSQIKAIKTFHTIGNELKQQSASVLTRMLRRDKQFSMKELKLIDCRISAGVSEQLLSVLSQKCSLQTLCLCKAQYSPTGVRHLCTLIETAKNLTSLDISWCEMPMGSSNSFYPILQAISTNRRLVSLDLSWNNLADIGRSVRNDQEIPTDRISEPSLYPAQCATFLAAFIKYNKHAQHVRLDNCSLTDEMMEILTAAIRKAPALQALHLSNNPFISSSQARDAIEELREKIHARQPYPTYVRMPQERILNKPQSKHELLLLQAIRMKNESLSPFQLSVTDAFYNNTLILQRKLGHKVDIPGSGQWQIVTDFSKHFQPDFDENALKASAEATSEELDQEQRPQRLPTLANESAQTNCGCWICQNESYVLIFWSRSIQRRVRLREARLQQLYVDRFAYHLSQGGTSDSSTAMTNAAEASPIRIVGEGSECPREADLAAPPRIVSSSLNNWHPTEMRSMKSFVRALDPEGFRPPDYVRILKDRKQVPEWAPDDPAELAPNARVLYEEERCHFERVCRHQWINVLMGSVRYPKPELVNADLALKVFQATHSENVDEWEDAYVLPVFLKPGKHTILVEWPKGAEVHRTLQTLIVEPREARIPPYQKQMAAKGLDRRIFHKPTSVFATFKEGGDEIASKCLQDHDLLPLHKKLRRFIKDGDQLDRVTKAVSDHMPQILHMYVNLQSQSQSYPAIPGDTIQDFASSLGILDNVCTPAIINIMYTSSTFKDKLELTDEQKATAHKMKLKVEKDKDALPLAQDMLRYEFIEFLIRIARAKFVETGQTKDYMQAFNHLLGDFVPQWEPSSFRVQDWRKKQLWTLEAHDCFEINLEALKKLYKHLHHKTRKTMNNKEAMAFMQHGATLKRKQAKRGATLELDVKDLKKLQTFDAKIIEASLGKLDSNKGEQQIQVGSRALSPAEQVSRPSSAEDDDESANENQQKSLKHANTMKRKDTRRRSSIIGGQDLYDSSFLNLNERQARACYAFAKMTVVGETGETQFKSVGVNCQCAVCRYGLSI